MMDSDPRPSDTDALVTERLRRYRPAGPPARLRRRLAPPAGMRLPWAVAALLALAAVGFGWATVRVEQRTATLLGDTVSPELIDPLDGFDGVTR